MRVSGPLEKAKLYIESHSKQSSAIKKFHYKLPCITISRQTGAGANAVAKILCSKLEGNYKKNLPPWTVFDKNLINKVLEDNNLPESLADLMKEDKYSVIESLMTEILTGQPETFTLFKKTTKTILQLAQLGNVIIIGRAGSVILSKLENVINIRLVASTEFRIKNLQKAYNFSRLDAAKFLEEDDKQRQNYVKTYFHKDISDPLLYDAVINTSKISFEETAETIFLLVKLKYPRLFD